MPQLVHFYKITSTNTPKVYVGSTRHSIHERLIRHELDYVNYNNGYGNRTTSHEILIFNNYSIHLLESALCLTKDDRNTIEQKHILNTPITVSISNFQVEPKNNITKTPKKIETKNTIVIAGEHILHKIN